MNNYHQVSSHAYESIVVLDCEIILSGGKIFFILLDIIVDEGILLQCFFSRTI